ncbi:hypothetical protein OF001_U20018 [Pseudomonas sp. OF001]|nr:hypothetical protein OF001_U20018 [Pseudomonas sp. OF001]
MAAWWRNPPTMPQGIALAGLAARGWVTAYGLAHPALASSARHVQGGTHATQVAMDSAAGRAGAGRAVRLAAARRRGAAPGRAAAAAAGAGRACGAGAGAGDPPRRVAGDPHRTPRRRLGGAGQGRFPGGGRRGQSPAACAGRGAQGRGQDPQPGQPCPPGPGRARRGSGHPADPRGCRPGAAGAADRPDLAPGRPTGAAAGRRPGVAGRPAAAAGGQRAGLAGPAHQRHSLRRGSRGDGAPRRRRTARRLARVARAVQPRPAPAATRQEAGLRGSGQRHGHVVRQPGFRRRRAAGAGRFQGRPRTDLPPEHLRRRRTAGLLPPAGRAALAGARRRQGARRPTDRWPGVGLPSRGAAVPHAGQAGEGPAGPRRLSGRIPPRSLRWVKPGGLFSTRSLFILGTAVVKNAIRNTRSRRRVAAEVGYNKKNVFNVPSRAAPVVEQ